MPSIEESKVALKTVFVIVFGAVSITATVSSVYHGIVYNSERVEYVNDRIDKKTSRNASLIEALDDRIDILEQTGSDDDDGE
jgi:hypothetical protein